MNILFFCDHPIIATDGGISRITDSLICVFRNYGHKVFIISAKKKEHANVDKQHFYLPNDNYDEDCLLYAEDFCKNNKINLVINQSPNRNSICFFEKIKAICPIKIYTCMHNCPLTPILNYAYQKEFLLRSRGLTFLFFLLKNKIVKNLLVYLYYFKYRWLYTKVAQTSDKVLVLNEKLVEEFRFFIPSQYYSKITVVPNCLPLRDWKSLKKKEKILLWVGRVDTSVKRVDLILNAWKLIYKSNPEWELFVLGDGPCLNWAKKFVIKNHLEKVFFEGRVNPYPYYERASLVAVTSSHESFSLVTLEALQHSVVPVVMNSFPFASTLIQNGINGILVNQYSYVSLAESLNKLIKKEDLIDNMASNGCKSALKYSEATIYKEYWDELLK